jgi:hypothetical protein
VGFDGWTCRDAGGSARGADEGAYWTLDWDVLEYDAMQCDALQQGNEALSEARHELRRVFRGWEMCRERDSSGRHTVGGALSALLFTVAGALFVFFAYSADRATGCVVERVTLGVLAWRAEEREVPHSEPVYPSRAISPALAGSAGRESLCRSRTRGQLRNPGPLWISLLFHAARYCFEDVARLRLLLRGVLSDLFSLPRMSRHPLLLRCGGRRCVSR